MQPIGMILLTLNGFLTFEMISSVAVADSLRLNNQVATHQAINREDTSPRVRIPLKIIPMQKIFATKDGRQTPSFIPGAVLSQTLRASLGQANHFFVQDFHISTEPAELIDEDPTMKQPKAGTKVKVRLNIAKVYGKNRELEEDMGTLEVAGTLAGDKDLFVLQANVKKAFTNQLKEPTATVVAGAL